MQMKQIRLSVNEPYVMLFYFLKDFLRAEVYEFDYASIFMGMVRYIMDQRLTHEEGLYRDLVRQKFHEYKILPNDYLKIESQLLAFLIQILEPAFVIIENIKQDKNCNLKGYFVNYSENEREIIIGFAYGSIQPNGFFENADGSDKMLIWSETDYHQGV